MTTYEKIVEKSEKRGEIRGEIRGEKRGIIKGKKEMILNAHDNDYSVEQISIISDMESDEIIALHRENGRTISD